MVYIVDWFLRIGMCLILISLVLELLSCLFKPIAYTDKTRKLDDIWMGTFVVLFSSGVVSCLIWLCSLMITSPLNI